MSSFCYFRFFAEVGTEVPLPPGWDFCLAVVPHGGAVVLRVRKYRPQLASVSVLGSRQYRGTVRLYRTAWLQAEVPHGLAVVPLARRGSTVGRGLVGG